MATGSTRTRSGLSERLLRLSQPRPVKNQARWSYGFQDQIFKEKLLRENRFYASIWDQRPHAFTPEPARSLSPEKPQAWEMRGRHERGKERPLHLSQSAALPNAQEVTPLSYVSFKEPQSRSVFAYDRIDRKTNKGMTINPLTGELADYGQPLNKSFSGESQKPENAIKTTHARYNSFTVRSDPVRLRPSMYGARADYLPHPPHFPNINSPPIRKGMGYRLTRDLLV